MLTKRHIKKHLNKISASLADEGNPPGAMWYAFHDYAVKHYKRLDKGARALSDEIFDELDARVKAWIDSLPQGQEKKKLFKHCLAVFIGFNNLNQFGFAGLTLKS